MAPKTRPSLTPEAINRNRKKLNHKDVNFGIKPIAIRKFPGGQPCKFTRETLIKLVNEYLALADKNGEVRKITSLALHLGLTSTEHYAQLARNPEFSDILNWARLAVKEDYERIVVNKENSNGAQFMLRCMGMHDKQVIETTNTNLTATVNADTVVNMDDEKIAERLQFLKGRLNADEEEED